MPLHPKKNKAIKRNFLGSLYREHLVIGRRTTQEEQNFCVQNGGDVTEWRPRDLGSIFRVSRPEAVRLARPCSGG